MLRALPVTYGVTSNTFVLRFANEFDCRFFGSRSEEHGFGETPLVLPHPNRNFKTAPRGEQSLPNNLRRDEGRSPELSVKILRREADPVKTHIS